MDVLLVLLLGLVVGSFLNVCIHRIPAGRSVVGPRSACPRCGRSIPFYDNIPVIGYLLLLGRCRQCRQPISWHYPVVESANGVVWAIIYLAWGLTPGAVLYAAFASNLIVLAFIDAQHRILPHGLTVGGLVLGLATCPWQPLHLEALAFPRGLLFLFGVEAAPEAVLCLINALAGMVFGAGMLLVVAVGYWLVRREEGMGHGDIILMAFVGAVLGWQNALLTIFLGSLTGAVAGLALIAATGDRRYQIPFGTFLGFGALVALLAGEQILTWYWNLA